jgi:hypothetical protein
MTEFTFHDVAQNTDEWHALRLGRATASCFGTFMANDGKAFGEPANCYALQIALERLTKRRAESFTNEHMERGYEQEPIARMLYAQEHFATIKNGGFFACGEFGSSPDGLLGDDGLIEIKSVIPATHYATIRRGNYDPAYKWQMVGHLDCTGRDWVDFVSYCADFPEDQQLAVYRMHRGEVPGELARLRDRRSEFLKLVRTTMVVINPDLAWPIAA